MSEKAERLAQFSLTKAIPDPKGTLKFSLVPLEECIKTALVILDTNVLLAPFTTAPKSLLEISKIYKTLVDSKRLFVPEHVLREFARQRIEQIKNVYQQLHQAQSASQLRGVDLSEPFREHQSYKEIIQLEKEIDRLLKERRSKIDGLLNQLRLSQTDDRLTATYKEIGLYDFTCAPDPSFTEEKINQEFNERLGSRRPPGFNDAGKDNNNIGDLIIWLSIISIATSAKKHVVFVSNDEKNDWTHRSSNNSLFARFELVDEFRIATGGQSFHIVPFANFLEIFGASVSTVQQVKLAFVGESFSSPAANVVRYENAATWQGIAQRAEAAVGEYLASRFPNDLILNEPRARGYDFLITRRNIKILVEVKLIRSRTQLLQRVSEAVSQLKVYREPEDGPFALYLFVVFESEGSAIAAEDLFFDATMVARDAKLAIGYLESTSLRFVPLMNNLDLLIEEAN